MADITSSGVLSNLHDDDDDDRSFENLLASLALTEKDRKVQAMGMEGLVVDLTSRCKDGRAMDCERSDEAITGSAYQRQGTSTSYAEDSMSEDDSSSSSRSSMEQTAVMFDARSDNERGSDGDDDSGDDALAADPSSPWTFDATRREYSLGRSSAHQGDDSESTWPKIAIPKQLFRSLYDFQKTGVQWMASLHNRSVGGGMLGDDMGMGKSYTTLTFLGGLMRAMTIRNALVVAPVSVLRSWEKEAGRVLKKCVPHCRIVVLTSNVRERGQVLKRALECSISSPCLLVSTYDLVRRSTRDFQSKHGYWDYVVLDEGHTIKNHEAQKCRACRSVCRNPDPRRFPNTRRLMLTGTPIMNNLKELWCLFDWVTSRKLLGPEKAFTERCAKPIENARDKDASEGEVRKSQQVNAELQEKLRPHFLQRLKADYLRDKLPQKIEMVVWTHLTPEQRRIYEEFVGGENSIFRAIERGEINSALDAITWLKRLCGHPLLVDPRMPKILKPALRSIHRRDLLRRCQKLQVAVDMVLQFRNHGHRTLIFSQSTRMLDILQSALKGISVSRIDGNTKEMDRQKRVDEFNTRGTYDVMLLSTKAAGVGLTLTGADVVIVYDPSWTPADDNQAVDRAYRIGQTRPVHVYRLITAGTVEEKVYERQIHKEGIRRTVFTESLLVPRYFQRSELRRLFQLSPPGVCRVLEMMSKETGHRNAHFHPHQFVAEHQGILGLSRHDGLYSTEQEQESERPGESSSPFAGAMVALADSASLHLNSVDLNALPVEPAPPAARRPAQNLMAKKTKPTPPVRHRPPSTNPTATAPRPRSVPSTVQVVEMVDSSDNEENHPPDEVEALSSGIATINVSASGGAEAVNRAPSENASERLREAVALHERGESKRSLQVLMSILKDGYRHLTSPEKMRVHHAVAAAVSTTGLCQRMLVDSSAP